MGDEVPHELVESLEATAREFRRDVIRAAVATGQRPPAGSLSVADLLSVLVAHEIRADPDHPDGPDRDRLVLSRSDAAAALRPALIHQGFVARDALRPPEGRAPPSPDPRDGFELGLGTAVGLALDARLDRRGTRVYAVAGDGECQNGGTWEALLAAGHYRLENLVVVFDRNEFEADGATETLLGIEPLVDKLRAFRFRTVEIDGHDIREILAAFAAARRARDDPNAIVAHTVAGKGVSFLENSPSGHDRTFTKDEADRALAELGVGSAEVRP